MVTAEARPWGGAVREPEVFPTMFHSERAPWNMVGTGYKDGLFRSLEAVCREPLKSVARAAAQHLVSIVRTAALPKRGGLLRCAVWT